MKHTERHSMKSFTPSAARSGLIVRLSPLCASLCFALAFSAAQAQTTPPPAEAPAASASALPPITAEVRRIDLAANKVSLKHGEIPNLDMPPMTMVFQMKDPAQFKDVKVGDKVTVTVDDVNGAMTVMSLQR